MATNDESNDDLRELSASLTIERMAAHRPPTDSVGVMAFKVLRHLEKQHEDDDVCAVDTTAEDAHQVHRTSKLVDELSQTESSPILENGHHVDLSELTMPAIHIAFSSTSSLPLRACAANSAGVTPQSHGSPWTKLDLSSALRMQNGISSRPATTVSLSVPHSPDAASSDGTPLSSSRTAPDVEQPAAQIQRYYGASASPGDHPPQPTRLDVLAISVSHLAHLLSTPASETPKRTNRLLIVDCRPRSFYDARHIRHSISVPFHVAAVASIESAAASASPNTQDAAAMSSSAPSSPRLAQPSTLTSLQASLVLKRLEMSAQLQDADARQFRMHIGASVVVYDSSSDRLEGEGPASHFAGIFAAEGLAHSVHLLIGGFAAVLSQHGDLCTHSTCKSVADSFLNCVHPPATRVYVGKHKSTVAVGSFLSSPTRSESVAAGQLILEEDRSLHHPDRTDWGMSCNSRTK